MLSAEWDQVLPQLQWSGAIVASFCAAMVDLRCRRIPNKLTGPLFLAGVLLAMAAGGLSGVGSSVAGAIVTGFPFVVLWLLRAGGAGDAKMMIALGAWLGFTNGVVTLVGVGLAGGVVALGYAVARRQVASSAQNVMVMMGCAVFLARGATRFEDRQALVPSFKGPGGIPYGIAIFLGTCAAAACTWMWQA